MVAGSFASDSAAQANLSRVTQLVSSSSAPKVPPIVELLQWGWRGGGTGALLPGDGITRQVSLP